MLRFKQIISVSVLMFLSQNSWAELECDCYLVEPDTICALETGTRHWEQKLCDSILTVDSKTGISKQTYIIDDSAKVRVTGTYRARTSAKQLYGICLQRGMVVDVQMVTDKQGKATQKGPKCYRPDESEISKLKVKSIDGFKS
jgi:hypothetical protein